MNERAKVSRRALLRSSVFGVIAVSIPNIVYSQKSSAILIPDESADLFHRYPAIDDELVSQVVGASHFNFDLVKQVVLERPELARANWDWAFGDWESALGAASHVGRRDIATFLIGQGARPNIFTCAMFGELNAVKAMIVAMPGVQSTLGPHGITLLQHARAGLRSEFASARDKVKNEELIVYLEGLGDADQRQPNIEMTDEEKALYVGDYMYGEGPDDGFSVQINSRNLLSLGTLGNFGGSLYQKAANSFAYNGIFSVEINFQLKDKKVVSLTIIEPGLELKAIKVN